MTALCNEPEAFASNLILVQYNGQAARIAH